MKNITKGISALCILCLFAVPALAAEGAKQEEQFSMDSLRAEFRKDKREIVDIAMDFKDAKQQKQFLDIYAQYEKELTGIGSQKLQLIKELAEQDGKLDSKAAKNLTDRVFLVRKQRLDLARTYVDRLQKEMSPVIAARFLQLESLVQAVAQAEVAMELPFIEEVKTSKK